MSLMEENGKDKATFDSVRKQAKYIFDLCDQDANGFITKSDLLKLKDDLPLSQDQLLSVFESLDVHGRGFLTHHEFVSAFSDSSDKTGNDVVIIKDDDDGEDEYEEDDDDDDRNECYVSEPACKSDNFDDLIMSLSQCTMLKDLSTIRSLWGELSERGGGELMTSFEALITEVASIVDKAQQQYQGLKDALEKQRLRYNEEMYLMYSEVEARMAEHGAEKEEREKERRMRERLLQQLKDKDQLLQQLKLNQAALEAQYAQLNNRKAKQSPVTITTTTSSSSNDDEVDGNADNDDNEDVHDDDDDDDVLVNQVANGDNEDDDERNESMSSEISEWMEVERQHLMGYISQLERKNKDLQDVRDELEEQILSPRKQPSTSPPPKHQYVNPRYEIAEVPEIMVRTPARDQSSSPHHGNNNPHLFRVVFVGDSGVGKTSLMHRACCGDFNPSLPSTVGVDSQMCSRMVGDCKVVMQMWDTAGQERFRSFSQQYFRRADAVVAAYDISKPQSFVNLRAWMHDIEHSVENDTVLLLLGTKLDILKTCPFPVVSTDVGRKLALEYRASFFETSALEGHNVQEALMYLATVLKERHEREMEVSTSQYSLPVKLHPFRRASKQCCGSISL